MPGVIEIVQRTVAERSDTKARENAFEVAPVQDVELAERDAAGAHLFHRSLIFATPGVREGQPIERIAAGRQQGLRLARHRGAPVDQRAEYIEEQGFYHERHGCT